MNAPLARTLNFWTGGRSWLTCLTLSALWLGVTAWLRPLAIPDEGRYVGVAWDMLRSGDWRVPTLYGLPFFHTPPLFYWITAASMQVFGPSVTAARAAPWLASVAMTTGLFAFVARWVGVRQAWTSVVVLATLPLFYGASQYANLDQLVAGCITLAILGVAHAALAAPAGRPAPTVHGVRGVLAAGFLAAALGVLAKGLIGVVLPVLVLLIWGTLTRRLLKVLALLLWAPGWALFIAVVAPWFIAMHLQFEAFTHYFFVVQHFNRFTSTSFNSPEPGWFYAAVLLLLTLPWSLWLLGWLPRRARTGTAAVGADAPAHAPAEGPARKQVEVRVLMAVWTVCIAGFFSLPSSKLIGYILPALPPLAFLIAQATGRVRQPRWRALPGATTACAVLAALLCVGGVTAAHFYQPKSNQALAAVLRAARQPGEPVLFLNAYYYDVMFLARVDAPVQVVDAWLASDLAHDSWRRELVDAARFAPASTTRRLLQPQELVPALCAARSSWLIGAWPATTAPAWLAAQTPVHEFDGTALWHIQATTPAVRAALGCAAPGRATGTSE